MHSLSSVALLCHVSGHRPQTISIINVSCGLTRWARACVWLTQWHYFTYGYLTVLFHSASGQIHVISSIFKEIRQNALLSGRRPRASGADLRPIMLIAMDLWVIQPLLKIASGAHLRMHGINSTAETISTPRVNKWMASGRVSSRQSTTCRPNVKSETSVFSKPMSENKSYMNVAALHHKGCLQ